MYFRSSFFSGLFGQILCTDIMKVNCKSKYFIVEKLWALPYIILNRLVKIGYICNLW